MRRTAGIFVLLVAVWVLTGPAAAAAPPGTISTFAGDGGSTGTATNLAQVVFGAVVHDGDLYVADARWNVVRRIDLATGSQIIVAGNGLPGNGVEQYNGDGIPAVRAQLRSPVDLAIDSAGNLYIADFGNQRIRKVDRLDGAGTITTIAGIGQAGYNGDNIPAIAAQLNCPNGVDVDAAGNLYIADTVNNRIRRVDAVTGTITTVAGNGVGAGALLCLQVPPFTGGYNGDNQPATSAQLNSPVSVEVDGAGNLYIGDFWNHRIRKVDTGGTITTYAGTGDGGYDGDGVPATTTRIFNPRGLGLDAAGNLYFADEANHRIRRIDAVSQTITTVAGNGTKAVSEDGGPAVDAPLVFPKDVAADLAGNVYIADNADFPSSGYILSRRVRKVDAATGTITTVAGNRYEFYGGDGGLGKAGQFNEMLSVGVGAGCNVYMTNDRVLDPDLNRVRRVDCAGNLSTVAGTGVAGFGGDGGAAVDAQLQDPVGVEGDALGNLWIADSFNNRIRRVDATTGSIATVAGTGEGGFAGDGGPATAAKLFRPEGVALDSAGRLYVADSGNYRVRRVDVSPPYTITTVAGNGIFGFSGDGGPASSASIGYVHSAALDAAGNLYIADRNNNRIRKVDSATQTINTVAGNGAFCGNTPCPTGDGGPALLAQLNSPEGVALDAAGNLYIADGFNNRVRRVTAGANGTIDGTDIITTVAGTGDKAFGGDAGPATAAMLNFPHQVALDAGGNLYIADFANRRVRRVEAVGPPSAAVVASFRAVRTKLGVRVLWRTASEVGILGFRVWRVGSKGAARQVSRTLIAARRSGRAVGASYVFVDRGAVDARPYAYRLQAVGLEGRPRWLGYTRTR